MSIQVKNLIKYYGKQAALNGISFELEQGQILGFIGPNGAGKSTAMKIITGIIPANSGEVWVNGIKVEEGSLEIRRIMGYLPENNPLYTDMYVREYLDYVARHYPVAGNRKERIEKVIEETGLLPESHKKISELSKGYRQRVGLAQALVHDPEILILDEPTSGLDPNQIIEIRNLISKIGKEKTVILSTHIMQEVEAICDRVIIVRQGEIVADGKSGEIAGNAGIEKETMVLEFDKAPDTSKIEAIEGVIRLKKLSDNSILIETDPDRDLRAVLFNFAVSEGLAVLSMQKKEMSLEEVFQELTR
ncbi:MAG: gliding motility-associated ABC transporter ATP-binding subunit GldA [Bacteroidales bacterium]|nr:gliding motility-associated ABC transporter ATP-binding subunit GldA [Bacteroidales bacterium]